MPAATQYTWSMDPLLSTAVYMTQVASEPAYTATDSSLRTEEIPIARETFNAEYM